MTALHQLCCNHLHFLTGRRAQNALKIITRLLLISGFLCQPLKEFTVNHQRISWRRIGVFMLIATGLSNLFRFDLLGHQAMLTAVPGWLAVLLSVIAEGSGILLAALIARHYLGKMRPLPMQLFGNLPWIPLTMSAIALVLLSAVGVNNSYGMNPHWYGLVAAAGTLLYCVMEEYGWRGYLQTELGALADSLKYVLVGFCWYLWHLTFLTGASLADNLFFLGMMILGSWGIGQVATATKSILACACFHLIIQIMMFNALIRNGISLQEKAIILSVAAISYFWLVKKWERHQAALAATQPQHGLSTT
jgi:hypothetical protein